MEQKEYKRVLSIAGSDPSGGAGIQADIKAISANSCFAATAITAIVDENTMGVYGIHPVPIDFVKGQIRSVIDDIGVDAIKIGMLYSAELIIAVKETLAHYSIQNIVLDPVLVSTSGNSLLESDAVDVLKKELLPLARVITPNIPEAEALLNLKIHSQSEMVDFAKRLSDHRTISVYLKAGHFDNDVLTDIFYNAETDEILELSCPRIKTKNTHGTGCTLSSAIASFLAKGYSLNDAAMGAKKYINNAIVSGANFNIGKGNGPVNHFFERPTIE